MVKEKIFDSYISTGSYQEFIKAAHDLTVRKRSSYVCFANVHMLVEAHNDAAFNDVVNEADLVAPDGRPLSLFLRHFKGIHQDRVCGMDFMPDLLLHAALHKKSVYLYGCTEEVLQAIVARAARELPSLNIYGYYSPPFRTLSPEEKADVVTMINDANPDFVLVSLGCPKQEKWMAEHRGKINACMLGLGQAFKTYAGMEKRLPQWMQSLSLEWVYRLFQEPRRLWKRYLYTNTVFLLYLVRYLGESWFGTRSSSGVPKMAQKQ